jgi:hypothetical protein
MGKPSFLLLQMLYAILYHYKAVSLLEYIKEVYIEKELLKKSQI